MYLAASTRCTTAHDTGFAAMCPRRLLVCRQNQPPPAAQTAVSSAKRAIPFRAKRHEAERDAAAHALGARVTEHVSDMLRPRHVDRRPDVARARHTSSAQRCVAERRCLENRRRPGSAAVRGCRDADPAARARGRRRRQQDVSVRRINRDSGLVLRSGLSRHIYVARRRSRRGSRNDDRRDRDR